MDPRSLSCTGTDLTPRSLGSGTLQCCGNVGEGLILSRQREAAGPVRSCLEENMQPSPASHPSHICTLWTWGEGELHPDSLEAL